MTVWFAAHTFHDPQWSVAELLAAKGNRTVSVVLPALNEQDTVAGVVAAVRPLVGSLVDELVVLDSGSTDATMARAALAGATVITREQALPEIAPVPGKGEVLWRALAVTTGEVVVFLDSDLVETDPGFVTALLGPLLIDPSIALVKGFYRRPLRVEGEQSETGGGRVTELMARPLLAALRPELAGVIQPLGGEYAATRELLESVPFAPGYGVEIGLLLDTYAQRGLSAIAQVNLGVRKHRNRSLLELGVMSRQILGVALRRCGFDDAGDGLTQFTQHEHRWAALQYEVALADRPPMRDVRRR
ncbi:MAG: glucosyl-3-phosphoglycerate synthase [Mycobacteriaceae bacterium]